MTKVEFKFDIDEIVKIIPFNIKGMVSHLVVDDGGKRYYVKYYEKGALKPLGGQFFRENLLAKK